MHWKRLLFLTHRWAGIVLCALFALWFVSGIFMMYVEFPQLTPAEQRKGAATLDFSTARLTPAEAAARLSPQDFVTIGAPDGNRTTPPADAGQPLNVDDVRLGMLLARPVYVMHVKGRTQPRAVFADNGEVLRQTSPELAAAVVADFVGRAGMEGSTPRYLDSLQTDQWTVSSALNGYRPLLHFALNDAARTELYVSSTTAEVVRDATRQERVLNYFAAVTHWIYPTVLRRHADLWAWVVDIVAGAGTLLALSGLWIGILRWRWQRPPGKSAIPYRGWLRWHFITGAVFGVVVVTWVFSGLLSMNPAGVNPSRAPAVRESLVFSGKALTLPDFELPTFRVGDNVVAAELQHYDSQPFYAVTHRDGSMQPVPATSAPVHRPELAALLARVPTLMSGTPLADVAVLEQYDSYYYSRHPETGARPLPVIRARFADADSTWFYVDVASGTLLERSTRFNRLYRWLYNGLHSWDIPWLWRHRPLWDIVVIAFSLGGVILSVLGVVVGIRRLQFELRGSPVRRQPARPLQGWADSDDTDRAHLL